MHIRTLVAPCKTAPRVRRPRRARMPAPAALTFAVSLSLGAVAPAIAGPSGGVVVSGQGSISKPSTDTTVINQSSSQLQLNWNTFNVAANESVLFKQPSSSAIAFNRILDQNPSQIFGHVQGNGQVVLVNPNGFLIGRTATLNVNSLVVSSLNAIDFDPVSGRYRFSATGNPGSVINEGAITAGPGGSVTLLGGRVSNSGSIVADFGTVNLAAGRTATLDLAGDGLLRLEVNSEIVANSDGAASAVENSGTIRADGGRVLLTASAVKDVFSNLINNTGIVRANRIDDSGGSIELLGPGGDVLSSGTLDASAGDNKSSGGSVSVLGNRVALVGNASVDVSGAMNGGTALIGGDEHGSNPAVLDAQDTYVSPGATISADAGAHGDGGKVVVWANGATEYEGFLSARGGALSGNGGFAEVSGKESLIFTGTADLTALNGSWGTLLLDPDYIIIDNSNTLPPGLNTGTGLWDFGVDTGLGPNGAHIGAQRINTLLDTTSLTLNANNDITQTSASNIDVSADGAASGKSIALNSDGTMQLNGTIKLNGNLQLKVLNTNGAGTLDLQGTVELNGGSFGAESAGNLTMGGTVSTTGTGAVSLLSDNGTLTMQTGSSISAGSGVAALGAHGDITVTSIATTGSASVISSFGSISTGTHTGAAITAGQLDLEGDGGTVGVAGTGGAIDIDASQLQVTAINGDVYVENAGALLLTSGVGRTTGAGTGSVNVTTDNGALTMESVSANGPVVFWAKQGGVQWDGTGSGIQAPSTTLTAGNGSVGSLAHPIPLAVGSVTATATGGITLSGPGATLTLDGIIARGAGNIVGSTNDISIVNSVGTIVDSGAGIIGDDLTLTAGGAIGGSGTPIATGVNTLHTTANGGGTYIRNSGDVTLTSIVEGSGTGDVDISTTSGGSLTVGSVGSPTKVTLNASGGIVKGAPGTIITPNIDLQAGAGIGTSGQAISTNATTVSAVASGGDLYLTDTNAAPVTLTTATASAPGTLVNVTDTAGNLVVGTVGASGSVALTANAGAIVDDGNDTTKITTNHLNLSAGTGIGAASAPNDIDTAASSIDASTTNGGVYLTNNTGIPNSGLILGGTTGVTASGAAGTVSVTNASGDITVGTVSASNQAALTAAGSILAGTGTGISSTGAGGVSLNSGTNIGTVSNFAARTGAPIAVNTNNGPLTAISTSNTGQINLSIAGAPTVAAGHIQIGSGTGRAGTILLQSSNPLDLSNFSAGAINIGANNTSSLGFSTDAVLILPSLGGITDAPPNTLLVRGATDVVNGGASHNFTFSGGSLVFQSGSSGGATTLNTTVGQLDATIIGGGKALTVNQTGDLTLSNLSDTGGAVTVATTGNLTTGTVTGGTVGITATGNVTVGAISGTTVNLSSTGGALLDDNNNGTAITGTTVALSGTSLGAAGNELDTQATSLTASSSAGDIRVRQTGDLNLTAAATGGAVDVQGSGALTVVGATSGTGVTLASGTGDALNVNAAVNGGSQLVSLTSGAGGAIDLNAGVTTTGDVSLTAGVNGNRGAIAVGTGISVSAANLTATGASIGSGANPLNTAVSSLTAASSNGDIVVRQAVGDLTSLTANATGGTVDVQSGSGSISVVSASGSGVTLVAGGSSLTVGGPVSGGTGDVSLTASGVGGQINVNGAVSTTGNVALTAGTAGGRGAITSNGGTVSANTLTAMGASIGSSASNASRLGTTVTSLDATASNGGIYVKETDGLNLTANATGGALEVTTGNGALNVASASGNGITLTAGGAGALTLNGLVNAGAGAVDLTAGGAIVANNGSRVTGGAAVLRGSAIGASGARLNTTVDSVDAVTTNGGIFVTETDGLALTAASTNGSVDVATSGPLTVASASGNGVTLAANGAGGVLTLNGAVTAGAGNATLTSGGAMSVNAGVTATGGNASLTSGGALTLAGAVNAGAGNASLAATGPIVGGTGNSIAGNSVTLAGTAIGANGAPVNTAATSLNAASTGGDIFVHETDGLALTGSATGGALNVQAGGPLTVASASGAGVTLAGSSIGLNGSVNGSTGPVTLTSTGAITEGTGSQIAGNSLTASGSALGSSSNPLLTSVSSVNATSSNGGIFVNETDGVTLTAKATGGPVNVQTASGTITVSSAMGTGITLTAGGAGNGITVNGAIDGGTGDVALTAGSSASRGAITAGAGGSVAGGTLTADGSSVGSSASPLSTNISSLTANATQGGVYISEQNGLSLINVQAAGDVGVSSATGDITVHSVNAGNGLTLTASSGAIADDGDDSTLLTGKAVTLTARSIGAPSTLTGSVLDSKPRLDLDANTLNATATAGGIYINSMTGLSSVSVSASGGTGGNIELLTQAGDLNLQHVSASNNLLLSAGRNLFALPGLGTISARAAELRAGGADASAGSIGTLAQPLSLQLSAGNTLHIYVPQTLDTNDPNRAPSTLPSSGVTSTLTTFSAPNTLAGLAGFGQFQGLSDTLFTSPAETLVRSIQNQTATVQSVLGLDWKSFDPNVSLFGTLDPSVCLPGDQRDEEKGTPGC